MHDLLADVVFAALGAEDAVTSCPFVLAWAYAFSAQNNVGLVGAAYRPVVAFTMAVHARECDTDKLKFCCALRHLGVGCDVRCQLCALPEV